MRVNHLNIVVADMERSIAFYVGVLGMRVTFEVELNGDWIETVTGLPGASARCVFCAPSGGGTRFELLQYRIPEGTALPANSLANTAGLRHFALEVAGLDAWYARMRDAGIEAISAPISVPFTIVDGQRKRLFYLRDPDGAIVELCEIVSD